MRRGKGVAVAGYAAVHGISERPLGAIPKPATDLTTFEAEAARTYARIMMEMSPEERAWYQNRYIPVVQSSLVGRFKCR